ncbi:ABC transporter ATP-binding protein [Campylobacter sp.]|uniref:ABC transporter ATP-binding protein n=1 Tax=Campylobacter sp. TaxID=205 RepID=UPI0025C26B26|nr:ABC transporter ATP-binding protein [Campylobacter sp.]
MNKNYKEMGFKEVFQRFKPYYKEYWFYFALAILGMLLASGGTAASAYIIEPILNKIFIEKNVSLLYYMPLFVIVVYFLKNLGTYMQIYYISYVGTDILRRLRELVTQNILRLDMEFFHRYRSGELISRCTSDIGALQSIVSSIIPEILRESITTIGLLGVVIYQSPKLAFFALIVIPLAIIPLVIFAKKIKKIGRNAQEKNSDLISRLSEIFSNIELIKAYNANKNEIDKFAKSNNEVCHFALKGIRIEALSSPFMETMGSIGVAIVIMVGGKEVIDGNLNIGAFFSFLTALFLAYTPIKRLSSLFTKLQIAIAASERTFYLLDLKPQILGGSKKLEENIENISFKNVSLSYYENKMILKDINFSFNKGEILALVGSSGGGKSSIINLLMYFYEKNSGKILINNQDISCFDITSLRENISLVTQNIYIFNDTIAQNVAYAKNYDEERIIKVLKQANAYDFVQELGGITAELKEHGKNLSGGQKQRIAIARALYKDPQILIFDEATSALDNESEKAIIKTIENLKPNHLILIIAHRLSTIENADKIAVLDKGIIAAIGNDTDLLQSCEIYQKLKQKVKKNEKMT